MLRDDLENFKFQKSKRLFKDLRFCFSAGGIRLVHLVLVFCRGELPKKKDLRPGRYIPQLPAVSCQIDWPNEIP